MEAATMLTQLDPSGCQSIGTVRLATQNRQLQQICTNTANTFFFQSNPDVRVDVLQNSAGPQSVLHLLERNTLEAAAAAIKKQPPQPHSIPWPPRLRAKEMPQLLPVLRVKGQGHQKENRNHHITTASITENHVEVLEVSTCQQRSRYHRPI